MSVLLSGYKLASRGVRLSWAKRLYEGYDRSFYFEPTFDYLSDDGTELWQLQCAALRGEPYFTSLQDVIGLRERFAVYGRSLDVIRVQVCLEVMSQPDLAARLRGATPMPDSCFHFLGHDVGWLLGEHSLIMQPGFADHMPPLTQQAWLGRLNEHGLFERVEDAVEFRSLRYQEPGWNLNDMEILQVSLFAQ